MESSQQAKREKCSFLVVAVVYLQKGTVKWVGSPVPQILQSWDNDVLQWWLQALLCFFPQIRFISVIIITPSSLHWGAVPLLCSHEGTLASLRSCFCLCTYTGNRALENVFFDLGGVCVDKAPCEGSALQQGLSCSKGEGRPGHSLLAHGVEQGPVRYAYAPSLYFICIR